MYQHCSSTIHSTLFPFPLLRFFDFPPVSRLPRSLSTDIKKSIKCPISTADFSSSTSHTSPNTTSKSENRYVFVASHCRHLFPPSYKTYLIKCGSFSSRVSSPFGVPSICTHSLIERVLRSLYGRSTRYPSPPRQSYLSESTYNSLTSLLIWYMGGPDR